MNALVKKLSVALVSFFSAYSAWGTTTAMGQPAAIFIHEPNLLMFAAGALTGPAATGCAAGTNQWAISMDRPMGKALYAALLQAQSLGKQVFVVGYSDLCSDWGDRALPSYVVIVD